MCLLGVIGISPYAVYRLAQGNYVVGVADVIIVLSAISTTIYAWRTGDTVKPGIYASLILSAAATLIAIVGMFSMFLVYQGHVTQNRLLLSLLPLIAAFAH